MDRLAASAGGGNIVTTKSWASMDDDSEALQRLNVILKVAFAFTPRLQRAADPGPVQFGPQSCLHPCGCLSVLQRVWVWHPA